MLLAPKPIAEQLRALARDFLTLMRDGQYDQIWHYMIPVDAIELISTASAALFILRSESTGDSVSDPRAIEGLSPLFQEDAVFPNDDKGIRTAWFEGLRSGLERMGWLDPIDVESSKVFLRGSAAVLVADTAVTKRTLILPFVDEGRREYKVDLEAVAAFSMVITAHRLHRIATQTLERGGERLALHLYELAARLSPTYARLKQLVWDHPIVETFVTDTRKLELQAEYAYTILARDQAQMLLADPTISTPSVDMGAFLADTFRGYSSIPDVELTEQELELLYNMDDSILRRAIARILVGVNPTEAEREARKPHTPAEIGDMEIMVLRGSTLYHLVMPFKSGLEIKSNSVPLDFLDQIVRAHLYFQNSVVVFVTAKRCSEILRNQIKLLRDRTGWAIQVIEERDLARLLKINGLLVSGDAVVAAAEGSVPRRDSAGASRVAGDDAGVVGGKESAPG